MRDIGGPHSGAAGLHMSPGHRFAARGRGQTRPMAGIGGIRPERRDLSRRRDRQASWVLVLAALVSVLFFYPLALVLGVVATAYAWVSGEERAVVAGALVMVLTLLLLLFGAGSGFDGGLLEY
jgi:hypothetical protein